MVISYSDRCGEAGSGGDTPGSAAHLSTIQNPKSLSAIPSSQVVDLPERRIPEKTTTKGTVLDNDLTVRGEYLRHRQRRSPTARQRRT
jgi:hypothetical protein